MKTARMSQKEEVLKYIRDFGSITPLEAYRDLGCMRLASRISDLRKDGVAIVDEWIVVLNRYGQKRKVKRYSERVES